MRSLRTAARTVVLVTLTGVAPGCGYDNPGFKLKDSDPDSDSAAQTTNVSGVTMMTTTETSPTSTSTSTSISTTSEPMTTQGPGVSGSETSGSSVDPTTETPDTTTGMPQLEWPPCELEETVPGPSLLAVADTFLLNRGGGGECFEGGGANCMDLNLGGVPYFEVYYSDSGSSEDRKDDYASLFAARFDTPPHPKDQGVMVPETSVIGVRVTIHVTRPTVKDFWMPTTFNALSLATSDLWQEGGSGSDVAPCKSPGASFRCRECGIGDMCIGKNWPYETYPYQIKPKVELFVNLDNEPVAGADLEFDFSVEALAWLTKAGLLLMTESVPMAGRIGVNSKESKEGSQGPFIQYLYCPPKIIMP